MSIGFLTVILFACGFATLISGMPVAFGLGSIGLLFTFILWGPTGLFQIVTSTWSLMNDFLLLAVPLFVLMANVLTTSGVSEKLYKVIHQWLGGLRGGLEIGTIIICAIFAAMSGISAVGVVTMGVLALPEMLKRNHSKTLALGTIAAVGSPHTSQYNFCCLRERGASISREAIYGRSLAGNITFDHVYCFYRGNMLLPSIHESTYRKN